MQALNAAISSSCGLGALSAPSSWHGSSATILWLRAMRSPAMVKLSTTVSLRVWPVQRVVTAKPTAAWPASFSIASTTSPRAGRSRPFTRGFFTVSSTCFLLFYWPPRSPLGEQGSCLGHALGGPTRNGVQRVLEALVDHSGADVGPARGLM